MFSIKKVRSSLFLFSVFILGCIDPAKPEYDLINDLVYVEAFVSTEAGDSYAVISKSIIFSSGSGSDEPIDDASVFFVNTETNEQVSLDFENEYYFPPGDFAVSVGETWMLEVILSNGKKYISVPETVLEPVPIKSIEANYNPELVYNELMKSYVPGHVVSVSFDDPQNVNNYYYWNFSSFEKITTCMKCVGGIFRNGVCESYGYNPNVKTYYNYICDTECWQIRRAENIKIYSDELSDGLSVDNVRAADILLYTKENILVEMHQFSISASAYNYYKIIKDIVQNNSSFNAPPPAALVGNIYNPDDSEEYVLGRFTAAASVTENIFIDRGDISDEPIGGYQRVQLEGCEVCIDVPCDNSGCPVTTAPCEERRDRTGIMPPGWIE